MKKKYASKIGLELVIPLVLLFGFMLFYTFNEEAIWQSIVVFFPIIFFIVHLFLTTNYAINNQKLIIKCGFLFNETIDINSIKKIKETNNILSSPATSIDRLEINYGSFDSVLISPKDKQEFITDIQSINPNIEIEYKKK